MESAVEDRFDMHLFAQTWEGLKSRTGNRFSRHCLYDVYYLGKEDRWGTDMSECGGNSLSFYNLVNRASQIP